MNFYIYLGLVTLVAATWVGIVCAHKPADQTWLEYLGIREDRSGQPGGLYQPTDDFASQRTPGMGDLSTISDDEPDPEWVARLRKSVMAEAHADRARKTEGPR